MKHIILSMGQFYWQVCVYKNNCVGITLNTTPYSDRVANLSSEDIKTQNSHAEHSSFTGNYKTIFMYRDCDLKINYNWL